VPELVEGVEGVEGQELFPLSATIFFWQKKPEKGFSLQSGLGLTSSKEVLI